MFCVTKDEMVFASSLPFLLYAKMAAFNFRKKGCFKQLFKLKTV